MEVFFPRRVLRPKSLVLIWRLDLGQAQIWGRTHFLVSVRLKHRGFLLVISSQFPDPASGHPLSMIAGVH